jgi:pimeloyl-ACP methyl ester carboxylesterase
MLEGCSHLAHVEAPAAYRAAVQGFLDRLDER